MTDSSSNKRPDRSRGHGAVLLRAENLGKSFPGVRALDDVQLTLRAGQIHALLGENGAGKSTLIKIITGVHPQDDGTLEIDGTERRFSRPDEAMRAGVGVVHQERNVIADFTIAENIALQHLPTRQGMLDRKTMNDRATEALSRLGVDLDPDRLISGLSAAQIQLVEIAKALSTDSQVLLLDEPTASITPHEAEVLFDVVRKVAEDGAVVVFVSHRLEEVFELCDTVTVLRDGKSVIEGQPLTDLTRDDVVNAMVGRQLQAIKLPERPAVTEDVPALRLSGVSTSLGHTDVDISVRHGEIVALYGLIGAGRSELAKAILGEYRITGGTVEVNGRPVRIRTVREGIEKHKIGYVSEDRKNEGVFLGHSIRRNIGVTTWRRMTKLGWFSTAKEHATARKQIADLDIKVSGPAQLAGQLSGGNQQKVSLGKWLAARPEILIIDEPTVGIDIRTKGAFHELIWQLATEGLAVLLISSDLPETVVLADRIVVFRDYRVVGEIEVGDHDYDRVSQQVIRAIHDAPDREVEALLDEGVG